MSNVAGLYFVWESVWERDYRLKPYMTDALDALQLRIYEKIRSQ